MKRRLLFILALVAMVMSSIVAASAGESSYVVPDDAVAQKATMYIVQMDGAPVVAYEGGVPGLRATAPGKGEKINPNSVHVQRYVDHLRARHDAVLGKVNGGNSKVYSYAYSFDGFAATLTPAQVAALESEPNVLNIWEDEERFLDTSTTPDFLGLTGEGGPWDIGAVGEDVIIGIVDGGIWPESLSFTDRTGTNPNGKDDKLDYRQIPGWHGKCVPGEEFNASMCNQKLIGAQYYNAGCGGNAGIDATLPWEFNSPRDYGGHGTHVASTAGGNAGVPAVVDGVDLGAVSGMAPRARIAAYKVCWETGSGGSCFTVDSVAAIDQAVADGVDVINFSISGSRTRVDDPVEIAFLFAARAGVFVAASAGNSGPGASTVAHNSPWLTTVAAGTHDRFYAGTVTLGDGAVYEGASIDSRGAGPAELVYSANVGLDGADPTEAGLCYPGTLDPAEVTGKIVLCDRGVIARVDKSLAVAMAGGIGAILANTGPSSINADLHYVPTVHVDHIAGTAIRTYANAGGGTATLTGGDFQQAEAPFVAAFSSRGPALAAAGDVLKPDIMAPGVDVLAAVAPPGNGGREFDFYSGTSMSSPHIAGLAALVRSYHPDWSPMAIKSALMTTASTVNNVGNDIPGGPFGYGAGQVTPASALDPGLVYDAGWLDWLSYLCGQSPIVSAGTCSTLASLGYSFDASDLNYPSFAIGALAGAQTVSRTVTNVGPAGMYEVSVDAPPGVDVTVDPASLTLGEGESADYTVTFTLNDEAVLNAYTFGSLTWAHGPHHVTSPIAVRPVQLGVPGTVEGSGTEGSLSFDVSFGYTGDYTAAPHGLVAADMQDGNVADDPTNNINAALATCDFNTWPYDCVGITWHEFTVPAGEALARFSLFDDYTDGNDDLDLYVWRRSGPFVGSSGSGTSAERVDVLFPVADTYEIAVHGWGTDGPDANYTLFSWSFSATPGSSNMTVTAPAAASVGATDTVTVDWTGLDAGTKYLGAVSHSNGGTLLDITLVDIDTD